MLEAELAEILGDGKPKATRHKRAYGRPVREIVLEYMRTLARPVTTKEVQVGLHAHARVDMPSGTVSYAISQLKQDGWVGTDNGSTYYAIKAGYSPGHPSQVPLDIDA